MKKLVIVYAVLLMGCSTALADATSRLMELDKEQKQLAQQEAQANQQLNAINQQLNAIRQRFIYNQGAIEELKKLEPVKPVEQLMESE